MWEPGQSQQLKHSVQPWRDGVGAEQLFKVLDYLDRAAELTAFSVEESMGILQTRGEVTWLLNKTSLLEGAKKDVHMSFLLSQTRDGRTLVLSALIKMGLKDTLGAYEDAKSAVRALLTLRVCPPQLGDLLEGA